MSEVQGNAKAHDIAMHIDYRLDAGYTIGTVMDVLTENKRRFVGRLRNNSKLDALAAEHLTRPEATMLLALLAFNLNTVCRNEHEDCVGGCWDLTRFQLFVLKVGGEVVKHSRRLIMRIAESAEPLWSRLTQRIESWLPVDALVVAQPSGFMPPPSHAHLSEVLRY